MNTPETKYNIAGKNLRKLKKKRQKRGREWLKNTRAKKCLK